MPVPEIPIPAKSKKKPIAHLLTPVPMVRMIWIVGVDQAQLHIHDEKEKDWYIAEKATLPLSRKMADDWTIGFERNLRVRAIEILTAAF